MKDDVLSVITETLELGSGIEWLEIEREELLPFDPRFREIYEDPELSDFFKDGRPKRIIMIVYAPFKNGKEVYSYPDPDNLTKRLKIQSVKYDIITESVI